MDDAKIVQLYWERDEQRKSWKCHFLQNRDVYVILGGFIFWNVMVK
jgi:hypothetical protein